MVLFDDIEGKQLPRRSVLLATSTSLAAIAGCTGSEGNDADDTTDETELDEENNATPEPTPEDSPTSHQGEAAFTISGDAPEQVEAGEELTYEVVVENEGGATGEATFGLDISVVEEDRWEPVFEEEIELEPGESVTNSSDPFTFDESMTVQWEFWISGPNQEDSAKLQTKVVTPTRQFGESFQTPHDLIITAANARLTGRYEYEDYSGDEVVQRAPDGKQFAFVDLTVENNAGETRETPNRLDFELVAGNQQYEPMGRTEYERDDGYDGLNEILDGVVQEGVQAFVISDDVGEDELVLYHRGIDTDTSTDWEVIWE